MTKTDPLKGIPDIKLAPTSVGVLQRLNPWWSGQPQRVLPPLHRWPFPHLQRQLQKPIAPVIAVKGPRQVGKTVLQEQLIADLLGPGKIEPRRIFRVQFDEVTKFLQADTGLLRALWWFERNVLGESVNAAAHTGRVYLFLDELQNLPSWSDQLKHVVDTHSVQVLLTGSSALRIERGRDSLAGRIHDMQIGPLLLREVALFRGTGNITPYLPFNGAAPLKKPDFWTGIEPWANGHAALRDPAFERWAELGGFPFAHAGGGQVWSAVADHLVQTVVRRAIQHDLRMGRRGARRDAGLLEAVFRMACRYVGQFPNVNTFAREVNAAIGGGVSHLTVSNYLKFLDGTLLERRIPPMEARAARAGAALKFVLCDHAVRAASLQEVVPLTGTELDSADGPTRTMAGRIADSVVGQFFAETPGVQLTHLPPKTAVPEIDYILTVGDQRIPVEVKYRSGAAVGNDSAALSWFTGNPINKAPFGLLITRDEGVVSTDPAIIPVSLRSLLLIR